MNQIQTAFKSNKPPINRLICPGDMFRHYKGAHYKVTNIPNHPKHTETEETLIVYFDITKPNEFWARPLDMFNEYVNLNGADQLRFEPISENYN